MTVGTEMVARMCLLSMTKMILVWCMVCEFLLGYCTMPGLSHHRHSHHTAGMTPEQTNVIGIALNCLLIIWHNVHNIIRWCKDTSDNISTLIYYARYTLPVYSKR